MDFDKTEEERELNKLVANLASAVNKTLAQSKTVEMVMERMKRKGYTIELALLAHIVMYSKDKSKPLVKDTELLNSKTSPLVYEFNPDDVKFLKSLRISVGDSESSDS